MAREAILSPLDTLKPIFYKKNIRNNWDLHYRIPQKHKSIGYIDFAN